MAKIYKLEVRGQYNDILMVTDGINGVKINNVHIIKEGREILNSAQLATHLSSGYGVSGAHSEKKMQNMDIVKKNKENLDFTKPYFVSIDGENHLYLTVTKDTYQLIRCSDSIKNGGVLKVGILTEYGFIMVAKYDNIERYLGIEKVTKDFRLVLEGARSYKLEDCMESLKTVCEMKAKVESAMETKEKYIKEEHPKFEKIRESIISYVEKDFEGVVPNAMDFDNLEGGEDSEDFRTCTVCGKRMYDGFVIESGEGYCCDDECLNTEMSKKEWQDLYDNGEGDSYWTTFY